MKRLLAVSWELPPMYGPRGAQVWRSLDALGERGWHSTVISMAPRRGGSHWPSGEDAPPPAATDIIRVSSLEESVSVRIAGRIVPSLRQRPDPQRVWVKPAARAALHAASTSRFAGLVTFAQPWSDHLVGLRIRREAGLPWVAHFSDPWADSPYVDASQRAHASRLETAVIREATAIVFVTEETADLVMRKYPAALRDKVAVVPHGFVNPAAPVPASRRPGAIRFVHTGRFYQGVRTPSALLQAIARTHARSPLTGVIEVTLVGPHGEPFATEARRLGIADIVTFRGRVGRAEAEAVAADADVLLIIDAPASGGPSVFLPSKLIDYLALRKPMLGLTPEPGASASLLRRLGCMVVAPDDVAAIADAIDQLAGQYRAGTLAVAPVFDAVSRDYDIRATTARLDRVLHQAFGLAS